MKGKAEKSKAEKGGAVKAAAEADLARRVGGSISSASQVRGAVGAVYAKYQPQGLRAIKVNQTDVSHYSFDVVARKIDKNNPKPERFMNGDSGAARLSGKATGITLRRWSRRGTRLSCLGWIKFARRTTLRAMVAEISELFDAWPGGPDEGWTARCEEPRPRCGRCVATFMAAGPAGLHLRSRRRATRGTSGPAAAHDGASIAARSAYEMESGREHG